jgi:antitoxin (DNA-binding transcriptional repressor) of toxin-antitoxin stability system
MLKQEVNISSFQKNLPELLDIVLSGDEIIITKSDIPVAKVSPIDSPKISIKNDFLTMRAMKNKRAHFNEAPENWFG